MAGDVAMVDISPPDFSRDLSVRICIVAITHVYRMLVYVDCCCSNVPSFFQAAPRTDEHLLTSHEDTDTDDAKLRQGQQRSDSSTLEVAGGGGQTRPQSKNVSSGSICMAPCELLEV